MVSGWEAFQQSAQNDLFSTQEQRDSEKLGKLQEMYLSELIPFKNHTFKVRDDNKMHELIILDYNFPFKSMYGTFSGFEQLDELNYLAARMQEMDSQEWDKFSEVVNSGISNASDVTDFINVILNLDKYDIIPAENEEELGRYVFENMFSENDLPEINDTNLSGYIDYEAIERDTVINGGRYFGSNGYITLVQ